MFRSCSEGFGELLGLRGAARYCAGAAALGKRMMPTNVCVSRSPAVK